MQKKYFFSLFFIITLSHSIKINSCWEFIYCCCGYEKEKEIESSLSFQEQSETVTIRTFNATSDSNPNESNNDALNAKKTVQKNNSYNSCNSSEDGFVRKNNKTTLNNCN